MTLPPRGYLRAQGLGNDYLVVEEAGFGLPMTAARARRLCDRHLGVGSDGVLVGSGPIAGADARVAIFNPDGSEAEKSGNGVRIFAAYCFARGGAPADRPLAIATRGGLTTARLRERRADELVLQVSLGHVRWEMHALPMIRADGRAPEAGESWIARPLTVGGREVLATCLSVGNPHAVLLGAPCDAATLAELGPAVERHAQFPQRVNVQLCEVIDRHAVRALVWERGAGPTQASGSSACAVVAACARAGRVELDAEVEVRMPGGNLSVRVSADGALEQTGPVAEIAVGTIADHLWRALERDG